MSKTKSHDPNLWMYGGFDPSRGPTLIQSVDPTSNCRFVAAQPHANGNIMSEITAQLVLIISITFFSFDDSVNDVSL